jgi:diadenosine tetraphosphatase ApaH/serine/threonine PP2A family protein phosphatase
MQVFPWLFLSLLAQPVAVPAVSDGPYLQLQPNQSAVTARWVCDDKIHQQQLTTDQLVPAVCGFQQPIRIDTRPPAGWQFHSARFAAISDIHGQYDLMLRLLQAGGIVDAKHNWSFGRNHLVVVGDVMDRGDKVTQALWLLYTLQQQARQAGGALHLLPGNHETMVLRGDLRYVHPQYLKVAGQLKTPLPALYGKDTVLGQWLRQLPLFIRINDTLFVHGGLSPQMASRAETAEQLQAGFQQSWGLTKDQLRQTDLPQLLQRSEGPLWYRGYFRANNKAPFDPQLLRQQLAEFGAKQIVVGHTSMDDVYLHHNGLVYSVDSSIKDGKSGAVLHFVDGQWFRSGLDGSLKPVLAAPAAPHKNEL